MISPENLISFKNIIANIKELSPQVEGLIVLNFVQIGISEKRNSILCSDLPVGANFS